MTLQPSNSRNEPPVSGTPDGDRGPDRGPDGGPDGPPRDRFQDLPAGDREALRDRDPEVLERFYNLYFDRVYAYVRRLLREAHLAEDLTQDIFMHIHQSLPSYDPTRALRPWVFTIATNKARDYWRSRRHQESLREVGSRDGDEAPPSASGDPGPRQELQARETTRAIEQAVQDLPDSMRTTLVMRYFEGMSFADIGEAVGRNEAAVRKRYSRALEELRASLSKTIDLRDD